MATANTSHPQVCNPRGNRLARGTHLGHRLGFALAGRLGPVRLPVVRSEFTPVHSAVDELFQRNTPLHGDTANPPIANGLGGYSQPISKRDDSTHHARCTRNYITHVHNGTPAVNNESTTSSPDEQSGQADGADNLDMDLYAYIDQLLQAKGRNWTWFAAQVKSSKQALSNWRVRGVPASRYKAIADALGMSIDELLAGARNDGFRPSEIGSHSVEAAPEADSAPATRLDWRTVAYLVHSGMPRGLTSEVIDQFLNAVDAKVAELERRHSRAKFTTPQRGK